MSTPARRALASAVLATTVSAGLVATGGAASAATVTVSDPVGDPVRFSFPDGGTETVTPAPRARNTDVTSVRLVLRNRVLVVTARAESAGRGVTAFVRVKGGGRDTYFQSTRKGGVDTDTDTDCAAGTSSSDAASGTYRLRIPTSCFGAPKQARLGFALLRNSAKAGAFTVDVAGRTGYDDDGDEIKLSKAVARG